jgi:hypothetical protein
MIRIGIIAAAAIILSAMFVPVSAQTPTPGAAPAATAKSSLTREKLREMIKNWKQNKPKLANCRKQVKAIGLVDDNRWFFIEDCMNKS